MEQLQDGTYLFQNGSFIRLDVKSGYWVAERELSPSELKSGQIVGVWRDSKTGKLWLDKTRLVDNLTRATQLATLWQQLAIWDNANQKEVRIG